MIRQKTETIYYPSGCYLVWEELDDGTVVNIYYHPDGTVKTSSTVPPLTYERYAWECPDTHVVVYPKGAPICLRK
jgi:hypothetical protein